MVLVPTKEWNASREVRNLIEETADLRRLYLGLGYSAEKDRKSEEFLDGLRSLLRLEIKDFRLFQNTFSRLSEKLKNANGVMSAHRK